jgi:hypothetical protein
MISKQIYAGRLHCTNAQLSLLSLPTSGNKHVELICLKIAHQRLWRLQQTLNIMFLFRSALLLPVAYFSHITESPL